MVLKVRVPQSRDVVKASTKGAAAYLSTSYNRYMHHAPVKFQT